MTRLILLLDSPIIIPLKIASPLTPAACYKKWEVQPGSVGWYYSHLMKHKNNCFF
ncbi:hypothetical protein NTG1052_570058 [Candidatus Nitrotoga sp. 1052]|nr:hypothetical protein NTG1052_570058 [Candidatus Nitrotoga sp. 1052]